jgi:hypothetical protein
LAIKKAIAKCYGPIIINKKEDKRGNIGLF